MSYYYTLDDTLRPVACDDLDAYTEWHSSMPSWSDWYDRKTCFGFQLLREEVSPGIEVSTVFLAINHDFLGEGEPVLWETMVFAGDWDGLYQDRYTSHADAVAGHRRVCRLIASEGIEALTSRSKT